MASYHQILYHLTFRTKNSQKVLHYSDNDELLRYIWGILKNKKCKLYRINAVSDHLHLVCHLHPSIALADLVKELKVSTSLWIKKGNHYPLFRGWAEGYGAFTISLKEKDQTIKYVMNQQEHHKKTDFREEYIRLLNENGVQFDEKYLL
jgi:putative transposase